ncbi:FAD-dependent oxidoreductase [Epibacterium ulvae]|uniref:NAD(P)/FAD-dependent oxidoreductase n=1 Tax=Epibacterium ulvae TaxID=1156985 RepID=UPI001BFC06F8|nr:FAD-dependent oxidoreductase [Epibacterium ulvae]MBT8154093.1 FAD-dependent oxidoreductase [Epibacterium ulvae]
MPKSVLIIGAGIIGISAALELQSKGFHVRVLDRKGVAAETSQGNAGAFAFSEVTPLATPGILRQAPKWLFDPLGPLSIPPRYAAQIAPWMYRFWRASRARRFGAARAAQTALMTLAQAATERQIKLVQGEDLIRRDGQLRLYDDPRQWQADQSQRAFLQEHGVLAHELLSTNDIAEIQPGLNPRFTHALYTPNWMNTVDPKTWTERLAQKFLSLGGVIDQTDVKALTRMGGKTRLETSQGPQSASTIILAAGAWSHSLAKGLGDAIPLETERGYNTTLPQGAFDLRTHLTFAAHGFVASRIQNGVRIGGAVELGGLELPPNFTRADALLHKAQDFMPDLNPQGGQQWMGYRPSLPDSLPVIDYAPNAPNVIYAFGHGHLGLTQAAATAEIIANLVSHAPPPIDLTPFSANRF